MSFGSPLSDSRGVKTLKESSIAQRVWDRLKEEGDTLPFSALPTHHIYYADKIFCSDGGWHLHGARELLLGVGEIEDTSFEGGILHTWE